MKTIGILELCDGPARSLSHGLAALLEKKQYYSITPQAVAVWCRRMGHRVHYATYYGLGDPKWRLPSELDIVFIACPTYLAPLAYALAKLYRREGTRTVLGGPHAKAFPHDAVRYFDLVVLDCDQALIADIVADRCAPHSIISSAQPYQDTPPLEERMPEVRAAAFWRGRPWAYSIVALLSSMGCPYACNFCVDWSSNYRVLDAERLAADLRFAAEHLPGAMLAFHDPNFGVRFDETLELFEVVPAARRNPYVIEISLSSLRRPDRLERLRGTRCVAVAPGIESWTQYSNKAGVGQAAGRQKLERVVEHLRWINEYVPYLQANFILGLDCDAGDEPFELTREFLRRAPFVYPFFNIPVAFGGTPLFHSLLQQGRILETMPFSFYETTYLTVILKHYEPIPFLQKMAGLYGELCSGGRIRARLASSATAGLKFIDTCRALFSRQRLAVLRRTVEALKSDPELHAFHRGESRELPAYYARAYRRQLGRYAELVPLEEARPVLGGPPATARPPVTATSPAPAVASGARMAAAAITAE